MKKGKRKMNDQMKKEIIKSLAYGLDTSTVAEAMQIEEDDIKSIAEECAAEIEAKAQSLKSEGWL